MTDRRNWKTGFSIGLVSERYLQLAAEAGIDVVEIFGVDGGNEIWEKLPLWQEQTGVQIWSLHLPFGGPELCDVATWDPFWWADSLRRYKRKILPAAAAGVKVAVLHGSCLEPIPNFMRESLFKAAIRHVAELNEICQANGMTLAVEDLPRTCLGNCSDEILRFVESVPGVKVCFDVNHLLKEDHSTFIKKVGKYIVTTHISDYDFVDEKHWFPLDGKIDWKKLQEDLEAADYAGPFLYETGLPGNRVLADVKKNKLELEKL